MKGDHEQISSINPECQGPEGAGDGDKERPAPDEHLQRGRAARAEEHQREAPGQGPQVGIHAGQRGRRTGIVWTFRYY